MRLVTMQFTSLDGVSQGPGGPDEDRSGGFTAGGWLVPFIDEDFLARVGAWVAPADALLFGRRTYENFARNWPQHTDPDDRFAAAMNTLPKYVVSTTLAAAGWRPTTIIGTDPAREVAELKDLPGREVQVHGSSRLSQWLMSQGLVDELRIVVAPVVLGQGRRLLGATIPQGLRLLESVTTTHGLTMQRYAYEGAARFGHYGV